MKRPIGGDRIGSGNKMDVEMKTYSRSTQDLNKPWRSTMAAGTIVPFMKMLALPGDTIDLELDVDVMTHPTVGPLFGRYKIELHVFEAPIRLYQAMLHNNALNVGNHMERVKLPTIKLRATKGMAEDADNGQINPSCILSYLGIRGVGRVAEDVEGDVVREFQAIPWISYWDIVKNYYANKQEEVGYVVHTVREELVDTVTEIEIGDDVIPESPLTGSGTLSDTNGIQITFSGTRPKENQIILNTDKGSFTIEEIGTVYYEDANDIYLSYNMSKGVLIVNSWRYVNTNESVVNKINLEEFPLENIDKLRNALLNNAESTTPKIINDLAIGAPYSLLLDAMGSEGELTSYISTQEGLAIKTYNSDKLNNWMSTEWIDGPGGISEISAIDTSGGSITIDTIVMARKVYNMLNRIALSGGTYKDYIDTVWTDMGNWICTTPMYHGGLIREVVFQEVISNSETTQQPLGTLAGKGIMGQKRKGGEITIKMKEPGYIMGLVSITPIIDYSQGNDWDIHLKAMNELHPPEMDEIGFQDLITEEMAWWDTEWDEENSEWVQKSAGKQPAWINYMTELPKTYGNFAIANNEMFMTLNRRYEYEEGVGIKDLTTYIDPAKYNFIFAQTSLDSQNFWVQIGIKNTARRLMSAKVMPNL